ncbi:MAG TPA: glycosyltransferase family 1 protein [Mycobacteriales bacterium]|nr:glycosyltransferase family 1 protein [Mycobacteriales bacterium]
MTRLAIVLEQCLAPVPGGTGRYARELATALAATAPPGSTVTGWTAYHRDPAAARIPSAGGPHRLPLPRRALVIAWERGLGPTPRGDLVHAPTPLAPRRASGRPLVVTVHDTVPWTHPGTLTPRGVAWHQRAIGYAARAADRIVVPTHAVAAELAAIFPAAARRIAVISEGVSAGLTPPPDAAERAVRLRLPDGGYLLSLATLEPRKGLDVLLAALASPKAPDLPLVVVGQPGWGGVDPLAKAAELGLRPDRVRLLGRLPDADLAVVLSRATVLAAPSRAEGFGLPPLEAMAAGVPVVSSDAPALVEVGGGATLVVPRDDHAALAEALAQVVHDGELRAGLVERGRRRAAEFSWTASGRALWRLYDDL